MYPRIHVHEKAYGWVKVRELLCWLVNIDRCNGLEPSGNKPLAQPMLVQIYVII